MKNYLGKTVECLCSGDEVHIYDGCFIEDCRPYRKETWAYNDEGQPIACIECEGVWAEVVKIQ